MRTSRPKLHIQIGYSVYVITNPSPAKLATLRQEKTVKSSILDAALGPLKERGLRYSYEFVAGDGKGMNELMRMKIMQG